jgi:ubiquinone/menaquinone biosynthesis C-methylase UbiE
MHNSTTRFSNRVEQYVKYRPGYPKEIIAFLHQQVELDDSKIIADIGSGTGISAQLFLENGNVVYAVEPNDAMRTKAEELFYTYTSFISTAATAEATTLPDSGIDLIVAGQAFHWFDAMKAKLEFSRIAKPNHHLKRHTKNYCIRMQ